MAVFRAIKAPKSVIIWDALPRSNVGKVLKKDMRAPFWADRDRAVGYSSAGDSWRAFVVFRFDRRREIRSCPSPSRCLNKGMKWVHMK
jgi:hypothetical protein